MASRYDKLIERISDRIVQRDGCWDWIGAANMQGLPVMRAPGTGTMRSARMVIAEAKGHDTEGKRIMMRCQNKSCVNPAHFKPLPVREVMRIVSEMGNEHLSKSGLRWKCGMHARKLTPEQVREIQQSDGTFRALAAQYGVSTKTIGRIRRGEGYRDVTVGAVWLGLMMRKAA